MCRRNRIVLGGGTYSRVVLALSCFLGSAKSGLRLGINLIKMGDGVDIVSQAGDPLH
jgi:hypothetical protein